MSRRTDNSPAISFFSFQDIITSVTGIMFLVVLILILMLLMSQDPASPQEQEDIRRSEELKKELAQLQEELDDAVTSTAQIKARLEELKKLNLAESEARLILLNAELRKILRENQLITEQTTQTRDELKLLASILEETRQHITQAKEEISSQTKKDTALSVKIQELQNQIESVKKTVRFTWQRSFAQKPLLVECGGNHIRTGNSNAQTPLASFTGNKPEAIMNGLFKWLARYPASDYYVLLLVKPSAFEYAEELSARLKQKGYERGREILPNDVVQIFKGDDQP